MPFKSRSQQKWMYANEPAMAKQWQKETPKGKKLPEHVKKAFQLGNGQPVQLPQRPMAPKAPVAPAGARPAPAPQMAQQQPHLRVPGSVQPVVGPQAQANLDQKKQSDVAAVQAMQAKVACQHLRLSALTKIALARK